MSSAETLSHDLFLLMLNLSQLKKPEHIIKLFIEAINSRELGLTVHHVDQGSCSGQRIEEIATQDSHFGGIRFEGDIKTLPPDVMPLLRNAVRMLALILENRRQAESLRHEKEQVVILSKKRNEIMLQSLIDGYSIVDLEGRILEVNDAYCKIVGYPREELLTMSVHDLDTVESREDVMHRIRKLVTAGAQRFETCHRRKDGTLVALDLSANYLDHDGGRIYTFLRDITERKRADEELKRSKEQFAIAFNTSPTVMSITTFEEGRIIEVNRAFIDMFGYDRDEIIGRTAHELGLYVDPEERTRIMAAIESNGRIAGMEVPVRIKSGEERACFFSGDRIDIGGETCLLITATDMTERREAEEEKLKLEAQLHQALKMEAVGQLAGGVAHDFNNILTTILGNVELTLEDLAAELSPDHALVQRLIEIERSAKRASTLTRQLLTFSRRQIAQPVVLDLNQTLSEMEKMLSRLITEEIIFTTFLDPELRFIRADAGQMEQVIMNLVVNARDAMPDGGRLTIETSNATLDDEYCDLHAEVEPGEYVMLAISDTGCGMQPHMVERIFEPFFTTKRMGEGTGLGLSTVYGIIKQSHGHISVYSEFEHGTTFKIYLPAVNKASKSISKSYSPVDKKDENAIQRGTETVLVSEDDIHVRSLIVLMLESAGYRVLPTLDGAQALAVAKEMDGPVHLLITDVIMPDMNGKKLADALTEWMPEIKVLFISGYTSNMIAHHGVIDEGVEFLEKPFTRQKLLKRIREILDKKTRQKSM
ncbi:MAG: PAS domain S-box protein [Planctomycetota bacterium]